MASGFYLKKNLESSKTKGTEFVKDEFSLLTSK